MAVIDAKTVKMGRENKIKIKLSLMSSKKFSV
jgi:hypothetical protein